MMYHLGKQLIYFLRECMVIHVGGDHVDGVACLCVLPYRSDDCSLKPCQVEPRANGVVCIDDVRFNMTS